MSWFKVDDGFDSHPKVLDVPLRSIGLWTKAGAWSARNLTDGAVPSAAIRLLGGTKADAQRLVDAGLWTVDRSGRDAVYRFHDWEDFNPTSSQVKEQRRKTAERVSNWRERRRNSVTESTGNSVTPPVRNAAPDPTRPDPTRSTSSRPSEHHQAPRATAAEGREELHPDSIAANALRLVPRRCAHHPEETLTTNGICRACKSEQLAGTA